MSMYAAIFYLLALILVASTALAVTRQNPVHAVVYLTVSFFASALLFYLLGAPLLAVLEVIIYAGAIMVLFLFIIMMIRMESVKRPFREYLRQWLPAFILGALSLVAATILIGAAPSGRTLLKPAMATPLAFGRFLFQTYWFPVEIVSLLLFVALVGALYLGRQERQPKE